MTCKPQPRQRSEAAHAANSTLPCAGADLPPHGLILSFSLPPPVFTAFSQCAPSLLVSYYYHNRIEPVARSIKSFG